MKKASFILFILVEVLFAQVNKSTYIIASGNRGTPYYKTGKFIAEQYNKYIKEGAFYVIETNASDENIELLKDNYADFAIIQRNVLIRDIFSEIVGAMKKIEIITPLFEEELWVYHRSDKDVNIREIEKLEKQGKIKVGFTSQKGESYFVFKDAVKLLDINYSNIEEVIAPYDSLIKFLREGKINFFVSFSLPIEELETDPKVKKAFFTYEDAVLLADRIPNLFISKIDSGNFYTIGTWTFLVALENKLADLPEDSLFDALLLPTSEKHKSVYDKIKASVETFRKNELHKQKLLTDLPLNLALEDYIDYREEDWGIFIAWTIFIVLLFTGAYFFIGRHISATTLTTFFRKNRILIIGLFVIVILYLASMELLIYAEEVYYRQLGEKSKLLYMTRTDLHSWMFVIMATGNSNDIFPLSLLGKFIVTLNGMGTIFGALFISISQFLTYKMEQKRKEGTMETKLKNHIVIFGWNGTTEKFVTSIINDSKQYLRQTARVVCVVPDIKKVLKEHKKIKELHEGHIIDIIQGDAREKITLERANVSDANTIILLAEDNTVSSDEKVLLRAMAISRYVRKERKTTYDSIYMVAEINNPEFKNDLLEADVNEVVSSGNYTKSIIKQAIFNHGVTKVLDEVLEYNQYNEFYKVDLQKPEHKHLVGKTFDELLVTLRKQGVLLIGIHVIFLDKQGNIVIDQEEIKRRLQEEENGLERDIIVNPVKQLEIERRTDGDDQLIVLAYDSKQLKEALKNVRFD